MAILTSHTLVAGLYAPYYSFRGWNSPQQGLLSQSFGTLDGSVNNVDLSSAWGLSNLYLESIYENFDPGGRDLKVFFDGLSSTTTSWYDIQINGTQFRRVDATSSAGATTYSRQYEWAGISSTIVENNTYSIVFTDDGTTGAGGVTGTEIPFSIATGAIDMNSIRDFFGDPTYGSNTISVTNLYRGGDLVPDITSNSSIPTSGSISLDDFYSCATVLRFDKQPSNLYIFEAGIEPTGTVQAQWVQTIIPSTQGTFDVGYGALKNAPNMEYRIILTGANQLTRIVFTGNTYTSSTSSYTSPWLVGYGTVQLERDWYAANNSFDITGTIQFEVRLTYNGTTYSETSSTATWQLHKINSIE